MQSDAQAADWRVRDVLVGVLRDTAQLEHNLSHVFYHMPAKLLTCPPENIRYVALYQSKQLFGEASSGVRLYGAVRRVTKLPRCEIAEIPSRRNPREAYYRFDVAEWQRLERPIRAGGLAPGVCMLTNRFLLEHGRSFPELYIRTEEQYRLYITLRRACARTVRSGGSELLPARDGNTVMIAGATIGVYTVDGRYELYSLREFLHRPHSFLNRMQGLLEPAE